MADFDPRELLTALLDGLTDSLAPAAAETAQDRAARRRIVVLKVAAFEPRDALEMTLAGHCVLLDHLLRDVVQDLVCEPAISVKIRLRAQACTVSRTFGSRLRDLDRAQRRNLTPSDAPRDHKPASVPSPSAEFSPMPDAPSVTPSPADANAAPLPHGGFMNRQARRVAERQQKKADRAAAQAARIAARAGARNSA